MLPKSVREARTIMGSERFFGLEDWAKQYKSVARAIKVPEFRWRKETLISPCPFVKRYQVWETHFAFLGLTKIGKTDLTILNLYRFYPYSGQPRFYFDPPHPYMKDEQAFNGEVCALEWYLMPIEPPKMFFGKTLQEQLALMPLAYTVASAVTEVTKRFLYHEKTGKHVGGKTDRVRCRNFHTGGDRTVVGPSTDDGTALFGMWEHEEYPFLGLALSRIRGG